MILTEAQGERLAEIFFAKSGILLAANRRESLAVRVEARLVELGLTSIEEYLARITSRPDSEDELRTFVESMLIGETSFFRENAQLEGLVQCAAPMLRNRLGSGRREITVWSAGCSIGCEPYTIAMLLTEHFPAWNIRVLGTDLNRDFLAEARVGEYHARCIRQVPERFLANPLYFKPVGDRFRVSDMIRSLVRFESHNLREDRFPDEVDMILCRNVMIYFEDDMIESMIGKFHRSLAPGGHLCVGSADNLFRFDAFFEPLRVVESTIYRHWSTERRAADAAGRVMAKERRRQRLAIPRLQGARHGETVTLRIAGVAGESVERFEARLVEAAAAGGKRLVIDLSDLHFISNESLHALRRFVTSRRETTAETVIVAPGASLRACLGRVRFGSRVRISAEAPRLGMTASERIGPLRSATEQRAVISRVLPAAPQPAERPYRITRQENDGIVIVRCAGDFDAERSPEIYEELNRHLQPAISAARPRIVIDLAEVTFLDDTHAAVLGRAARLAREHRGEILVSTRSDVITRILSRQVDPMKVAVSASDAVHLLSEGIVS